MRLVYSGEELIAMSPYKRFGLFIVYLILLIPTLFIRGIIWFFSKVVSLQLVTIVGWLSLVVAFSTSFLTVRAINTESLKSAYVLLSVISLVWLVLFMIDTMFVYFMDKMRPKVFFVMTIPVSGFGRWFPTVAILLFVAVMQENRLIDFGYLHWLLFIILVSCTFYFYDLLGQLAYKLGRHIRTV